MMLTDESINIAQQMLADQFPEFDGFFDTVTGATQSFDIVKSDKKFIQVLHTASQIRLPPIEPWISSTPFEAIACDYFLLRGWYYFVAADRLTGWTEQSRIKSGTKGAGSAALCSALRTISATFGVPVEISSDGGPEFTAKATENFLERWGVRHRISSAYLPSSNGRAELAVNATKRLLMENVGPDGNLNNDKMIRALLTQRNTPDPGCKLSPAQIYLVGN